jgi:predicted kinase
MIIMMHGLPVSGKSFLAKKICDSFVKNKISAEIVKSVATRDPASTKKFTVASIDEIVPRTCMEKDESYKKLLEMARERLSSGIIPILDATFHKRYRREWVYSLAQKLHEDLVVVSCVFDDEEEIGRILKERAQTDDKDAILDSSEMRRVMQEQADPLDRREWEKIVFFDRRNGVKATFTGGIADVVRDIYA